MKSVEGQAEYKLTSPYELVTPFKQWVYEQGYFIRNYVRSAPKIGQSFSDREPEFAIVVNEASHNDQYAYSSFEPLSELPELVFRFADLGGSPSHNEIISFADKYGLLGMQTEGYLYVEGEPPSKPKTGTGVEFFDDWYDALNKICPIIKLWRALQNQDQNFLKSNIVRNENCILYKHQNKIILHKALPRDKHKLSNIDVNDRVTPAKIHIVRCINSGLQAHCAPSLLYQDPAYSKAEIGISCLNMLGAFWLQFAKAVQGDRKILRCANCSQFFMVAEKRRGSPQKYCRPYCRYKAASLRKNI